MKLLSRLMIGLVVCLLAIPLLMPVAPVQADEEEIPQVWLYPDIDGYVGDEIQVRGEFLDAWSGTVWIFYEINDEWIMVDKDSINSAGDLESDDFTIPESAGATHRVRVCDSNDEDDYFISTTFRVRPMIEITTPDDAEGPVGTVVTVKGTGFEEDEEDIEIRFYLAGSDFETVESGITAGEHGSWTETFTVPASSKGDHKVDATGDGSSISEVKDTTFDVKPGISLNEASGYVGDSITVKGSGFEEDENDVKITYDGVVMRETEADENGVWQVSFDAPASAKGQHDIDAYGDDTKASDIGNKKFTISHKATMQPTEGHIDTQMTISGTGFAASQTVSIKYDGTQVATAATDNKGNLTGTFPAPKSKYGDHTVIASDASGNSASFTFVMESDAPGKPVLSLPTNDSRLGFFGKVAPTFEWLAVTDVSGVEYKLQIASDSTFASLVVPEISGLTAPGYVLPEGQALPYGTYYWKVKAIDGAQNDSGWTMASSFRSALLPLWAFIAIIALVVVLIAVLVYFFGIRRRVIYD